MSEWTLIEARECLALYKKAIRAASRGQSYSIEIQGERIQGDRQSLGELRRQINYFQEVINQLTRTESGGSIRLGRAVFYE